MRLLLVVTTLIWAGTTLADDQNNPQKGQFYLAPGAVIYTGPDGSKLGYEDPEIGVGVIVGYGISDRWSVEFMAAQVEAEFKNASGRGEEDVDLKWLNFVYKLPAREAWQPFVLLAGGRTDYDFGSSGRDKNDTQFNAGVG